MANFFNIDFNRLAVLLIPPLLREPLIIAFVQVLISPAAWLYRQFATWRDNNRYHLSITAQVCRLERVLNDRFDRYSRRIFITRGTVYDEAFIYTSGEGMDEYLFTEGESDYFYIYTRFETGAESADFIVHVPVDLGFDESEFRAVLDIYKAECKNYTITAIS